MSPVDLSDYVEVSERIALFREQYPEGSLQAEVIRWPEDGFAGIAVKGFAYRSEDDSRPGIGHAFEPVPGKTNYTRDSELQNAETSAWGRAIVAALAADTKRGVSSADEVRNRSARSESSGAESSAVDSDPAEVPGDASLSRSPGSTSPKAEGIGEGPSAEGQGGSPEEVVSETNDPASSGHRFTIPASECGHKLLTGEWAPTVQVKGQPRCGLCGTPAVRFREAS